MAVTRALSFAVVLAGAFVGGCDENKNTSKAPAKGFAATPDVTASEAKALMDGDKSIVYLDVRTVGEFEASRPVTSWNVPFLITNDAGAYAPNPDFLAVVEANFEKGDKLVIGCLAGGRSKKAQGVLKGAGYTNVVNMLGGFGGKRSVVGTMKHDGWSQLEFATEKGSGGARGYETLKAKVGS